MSGSRQSSLSSCSLRARSRVLRVLPKDLPKGPWGVLAGGLNGFIELAVVGDHNREVVAATSP